MIGNLIRIVTRVNRVRQYQVMALAMFLCGVPVHASSLYQVTTVPITIPQGTSGDTVDVTFTNMSGSPVNFSGFNWELSVGDPNISLRLADESTTAQYAFFGDSGDVILFSDPIISDGTANPGPGQILDGVDFTASGLDITVADGATLALGRVTIDVLTTASPGFYSLVFGGITSVSDSSNNQLAITTVDGSVTVVAPEPGTIGLAVLGMAALSLARFKRKRRD